MLTYNLWKWWIDIWIDEYSIAIEKIMVYAFLFELSIITIPIDLLTSVFQIVRLIIFLIKKKGKK